MSFLYGQITIEDDGEKLPKVEVVLSHRGELVPSPGPLLILSIPGFER